MLQTKESENLKDQLVEEHSESRRRAIAAKARLEAFSIALDLAAAHVDWAIQGADSPRTEQAFRQIPSAGEVISACAEYRAEAERSRQLATAIAGLGE